MTATTPHWASAARAVMQSVSTHVARLETSDGSIKIRRSVDTLRVSGVVKLQNCALPDSFDRSGDKGQGYFLHQGQVHNPFGHGNPAPREKRHGGAFWILCARRHVLYHKDCHPHVRAFLGWDFPPFEVGFALGQGLLHLQHAWGHPRRGCLPAHSELPRGCMLEADWQ